MRKRNPLSPTAYKYEPVPCAMVRPVGGLAPDDRAGVHFTNDTGLAIRYAAFKATKSESIAIILTYDLQGFKLEPDFDAEVEQKYSALRESNWYIKEFDILDDPDDPDYDKLADILERSIEGTDDMCNDDGPPWSVESELIKSSKKPLELIVAEHLRAGGEEAAEALQALSSGKAPLSYYSEMIHQWRTFSEVGDDRLLRVEAIRPFYDTVEGGDYPDEEPDPHDEAQRFYLDDIDYIIDNIQTKELYNRGVIKCHDNVYYHGTDLVRAKIILRDTGIKLYNPWDPCVQPSD